MSKHTQGPWNVEWAGSPHHDGKDGFKVCGRYELSRDTRLATGLTYGRIEVARVEITPRSGRAIEHYTEEGEANARLIAAAPRLLETLRALAPMFDNDSPLLTAYAAEVAAARAAIAEATT